MHASCILRPEMHLVPAVTSLKWIDSLSMWKYCDCFLSKYTLYSAENFHMGILFAYKPALHWQKPIYDSTFNGIFYRSKWREIRWSNDKFASLKCIQISSYNSKLIFTTNLSLQTGHSTTGLDLGWPQPQPPYTCFWSRGWFPHINQHKLTPAQSWWRISLYISSH